MNRSFYLFSWSLLLILSSYTVPVFGSSDVSELSVNWEEVPKVSKEELLNDKVDRNSASLWFGRDALDKETLIRLPKFSSVNTLRVTIGDKALQDDILHQVSLFPNLTSLSISGGDIGAPGLEHLSNSESLRSLSFYDLTREGFSALPEMKSLQYLDIQAKQKVAPDLVRMERFPELRYIFITGRFDDEDISNLKSLKHLQELKVSPLFQDSSLLTDLSLQSISEIKSLRKLKLYSMKYTVGGLAYLKDLPNLSVLHMPNAYLQEDSIVYMKEFPMIKDLKIRDNNFSPEAISTFKDYPMLETIQLFVASDETISYMNEHFDVVEKDRVWSKRFN